MRALKFALLAGTIFLSAAYAAEDGIHIDSGQPVMGRDTSGNARFLQTDTTGKIAVSATQGTYQSAGTQQNALAITTNTQLTVPTGTKCAYITVETASVRRTSDGSSASTTNGTLFASGAQWSDCGPLAAYKFTAVSGSPTLDVEYFK